MHTPFIVSLLTYRLKGSSEVKEQMLTRQCGLVSHDTVDADIMLSHTMRSIADYWHIEAMYQKPVNL